MGKKYIIELKDNTAWLQWVNVVDDGQVRFDFKYPEDLTPYTEPDFDAIRKEAFDEGYQEGMQLSIDDAKLKEAYRRGYEDGRKEVSEAQFCFCSYDKCKNRQEEYRRGLNDAWEATRKIYLPEDHGGLGMAVVGSIFNTDNRGWIFKKMPVTEAIEKIRQYEQEQKNKQEENKESCQNCKFAKNPKAQEPCVRCSHSFYNFFRAKVKETDNAMD